MFFSDVIAFIGSMLQFLLHDCETLPAFLYTSVTQLGLASRMMTTYLYCYDYKSKSDNLKGHFMAF